MKPYITTINNRYQCTAQIVGTATWITINDTGGHYAVDDARKVQMVPLYPDQVKRAHDGYQWRVAGLHRLMTELVKENYDV